MPTLSEEVLEEHSIGVLETLDLSFCSCSPNVTLTPYELAQHIAKAAVNHTIEHLAEGLRDSLNPDRMSIGNTADWIEAHREG